MGKSGLKMMKILLKASVLLCLWFRSVSAFSQFITKAAPKIGSQPPPLELSQIVQGPNLNDISWDKLKGKVVVLEFWATWCGPCIKAIPHLNDLAEQFKNKPVIFLSISDDNLDRLKQFLQRRPIKSWLTLDGPFSPTKAALGIVGIPTTFIIDKSGAIVAITHPAKLDAKHLEEILAGKLCSLSVPKPDTDEDIQPVSQSAASSNLAPMELSVSILGPFPFPTNNGGGFDSVGWNKEHTVFDAKKALVRDVLTGFFDINRELLMAEIKLPDGLYDITASAPPDQVLELRMRFADMVKTNLGISVQLTNREMEVYAMTLRSTNVSGLKQTEKAGGGGSFAGGFQLEGVTMDSVAGYFENQLGKSVVNDTKQLGLWCVEAKWKMSERELLPYQLDRKMNTLVISNPKAIISGDMPKEMRDKISDHDFKLLQAELVKPDDQQFLPDPAYVIRAAREQLGLEIKPASRTLQVVEVRSIK
jgi:uncharacterized protein (TIGR03435 family)